MPSCEAVSNLRTSHHQVHQCKKNYCTNSYDNNGFGRNGTLGVHGSGFCPFWIMYTVHPWFARRLMRFHTSDVWPAPICWTELFTKNGYPVCFDRIAPLTGTVTNADEIGERISRISCTGDTSKPGIGEGTTKVFGVGAVGQLN